MPNTTKWTQDLRRLVYRRLKQQFGPHSQWVLKYGPEHRKSEYDLALKETAAFLSQLTGNCFTPGAVQQQIAFVIAKGDIKKQGYVALMILNKAAALEVGFLETADLPSCVLSE